MDKLEHVTLNGDAEARYPGNLNLSFAYVEGESLLMGLKDIAEIGSHTSELQSPVPISYAVFC